MHFTRSFLRDRVYLIIDVAQCFCKVKVVHEAFHHGQKPVKLRALKLAATINRKQM